VAKCKALLNIISSIYKKRMQDRRSLSGDSALCASPAGHAKEECEADTKALHNPTHASFAALPS
jgi:hypothetical protein